MTRITRRRKQKTLLTFEERMNAAYWKAQLVAMRKCPDCGKLCRWAHGNTGSRAQCESCGG